MGSDADPLHDDRASRDGRAGSALVLPVAATATWGEKARHDVVGTIGGYRVRGSLTRVR